MGRVLPILFNTEMVRAILDDRKTVTRRVIRGKITINEAAGHKITFFPYKPRKDGVKSIKYFTMESFVEHESPYQPGDILYVRETWARVGEDVDRMFFEESGNMWDGMFLYKADGIDLSDIGKWHPSIHMPKEAARIWLKVTDVRVERLQDIGAKDCNREGIDINQSGTFKWFSALWDSTVKAEDRYSWYANPWVWVIEFERCGRPDGESRKRINGSREAAGL